MTELSLGSFVDLPLSWRTDIAVLVGSGSGSRSSRHLVVRTPANPTYAWGNFVMVTDPATVDDAARWEAVFASCFPDAGHRAIGLPVGPADASRPGRRPGWRSSTRTCWSATRHWSGDPLPEGYAVRPLSSDDDWERSRALRLADLTDEQRTEPHRRRTSARHRGRRRLVGSGNAVSSAPSRVTSWPPTRASWTAGREWRATRT